MQCRAWHKKQMLLAFFNKRKKCTCVTFLQFRWNPVNSFLGRKTQVVTLMTLCHDIISDALGTECQRTPAFSFACSYLSPSKTHILFLCGLDST